MLAVTNLIPVYDSMPSSKQMIRFWGKKNWIILHIAAQ